MIGVSGFVNRVEKIAARKLTYRTGGVGKDGTCDCIGLIMGAMYELGHKQYDLHSTNYFARYQTMGMKKVNERELFKGQILYRAQTNQDKLHARYLPGGRYYTGDLLDYFHVGVVTSVNPLRIIECTEYGDVSGIVVNEKLGRWHWGGKLRGVLYDETDQGGLYEEKEEEVVVLYQAKVITKEDPLTLRATPSGRKIGEIPKGETVDVIAEGQWARVRHGDAMGYVSAQYLERIDANTEDADDPEEMHTTTIVRDKTGSVIKLMGIWRIAED